MFPTLFNTMQKRKYAIFLLLWIFLMTVSAQQEPSFSHYWAMEPSFNPAAAGKESKINVTGAYAMTMTGFEHNPRTMYVAGDMPFMLMNKKQLGKLVDICFKTLGASETAVVIDNVKNLGYHYACIAGMTVAISDIKVPEKKQALLDEAEAKVKKTQRQFERGLISDEERYKKVCKVWDDATNLVADAMYDNYADNEPFNPIYMMADSGARGNKSQMRQLAGMRGQA